MRFWWVNQNQTHRFEVRGGYLWSPKTAKGGRKNHFYDTMAELQAGDVVFSFFDTKIQAVGVVQSQAVTAPKPEFGAAGKAWDSVGWLVDVEFVPCPAPFRPKEVIEDLIPHLPEKYAPLQKNGNGLQTIYLTEISESLAHRLLVHSQSELAVVLLDAAPLTPSYEDQPEEFKDAPKGTMGELQKQQLVLARRGQGIFKHNVRLVESRCRLTGLARARHLRASHIKPWSKANDAEKIDGANGLLLSPHVDHLFDRGFITFRASGDVLVSSKLEDDVLERWSLESVGNAGAFSREQSVYLDYHRDEVFETAV